MTDTNETLCKLTLNHEICDSILFSFGKKEKKIKFTMHHGLENKTKKETEPNIAKIFRVLKKHTKSEQVYQKLSPKQSYLQYGNSAYDQYVEDKLLHSVGCLPMIVKLKHLSTTD